MIFIQDLVTSKRGYILMSERQAKDFIKRAVAIYGSGIIPKAIRGDLELQGMLEFMGTNNESYYYNKLAKRIKE